MPASSSRPPTVYESAALEPPPARASASARAGRRKGARPLVGPGALPSGPGHWQGARYRSDSMAVDLTRFSLLLAKSRSSPQKLLLEALREHETASAEALRAAQLAHLTRWLPAVAHGVPSYRERLQPALRRGADLTWDHFGELPLLTRAELQDAGSAPECSSASERRLAFENPHPPPPFRPIGESTTSGSTGQPITTKTSRASSEWAQALRLRLLQWQAFDPEKTCAFIHRPFERGQADPPEGMDAGPWAPLGKGRAWVLNLHTGVDEQLEWLLRKRPTYLVTYPSNLLALLKSSEERNEHLTFLEAVSLSSEPVSEELVEFCSRQWGARCLATYSASETGLLALQVPGERDYLVQSENAVVEVLREDGSPCEPGEVGKVVVTTLQDLLRPLVRYEVGDYAEVGAAPAPDALRPGFPRLRRVVGRERTMVRLPDGRRVWPYFEFAPLIALGAIRQWQLVQQRDGSLVVRLVTRRALAPDEEQLVQKLVADSLPGLVPRIESVTHIERTPRGKYLEFVSEL